MAETQRVAVWPAELRPLTQFVETPYKFLDQKAGWLARLAWRLLHKLGALTPYMHETKSWEYVPSRQEALHEAMMRAASQDLRYVRDGKAVFIIGGATFSELCSAPVFRDYMRFDTGRFGTHDPYEGRRIFDIPIHIVPHMTGMALVPRVIIEAKQHGQT